MSENKEYYNMWAEFSTQFKKAILPCVRKYEDERKNKRRQTLVIQILCIFLSILLCLIALTGQNSASEFIFSLAGLAFVSAFVIPRFIKKQFENGLKEKIMPTVCRCLGNFTWCNYYPDSNQLFKESCLVPYYSYYNVDDVFNGRYKEVPIDIIEAEFKKQTRNSNGNRTESTVFKGVIIKLGITKNFNSHTVIKSKALIKLSPKNGLRRTELEDTEFQRQYDVYTNDEVEARYLLTTSFMERLKNIEVSFKARKSTIAFYDKSMFIALETPSDLFSLFSFKKPLDDIEQYKTMFSQVLSIVKLVNHFKLSEMTI